MMEKPALKWEARTAGSAWLRYANAVVPGLPMPDRDEETVVASIGQCRDETWTYTIFDHDGGDRRGVGLPSIEDAVGAVESWWAGMDLTPPTKASAEVRAEAYRNLLIGIVGTGDAGGYQDIEIIELMQSLGDLPDQRALRHADLHHMGMVSGLKLAAAFKAIDDAKSPEQKAQEAEADARRLRSHIYQSISDLGREVVLRLRQDPSKTRRDFGGQTLAHLERYGLIDPDTDALVFTDLGRQIADGIFKRLRKDLKPHYS